jgi:hypothetical protein
MRLNRKYDLPDAFMPLSTYSRRPGKDAIVMPNNTSKNQRVS